MRVNFRECGQINVNPRECSVNLVNVPPGFWAMWAIMKRSFSVTQIVDHRSVQTERRVGEQITKVREKAAENQTEMKEHFREQIAEVRAGEKLGVG